MVESTAKLRSEILALTGVDIMDGANQFKSTYAIMDELAQKWQDLTDIQQATVTELIAGKRQGNIVSSLMTNFDTARDALETSLNSSGSAMKEHEKWQQSLEAQINKLKASWQSLSQAFLKSDFLKSALDAIIELVDGLTKLIDTFGAFPTLLGVFAAFKGIPTIFSKITATVSELGGVGALKLKSFKDVLTLLQLAFPNVTKGIKGFVDALKNGIGSSDSFGKSIKGIFDALKQHWIIAVVVAAITILTAVIGYQNKQAEKLAKKVDELTEKYKEQHEELKKLKGDFDTSNEDSMISKYEKLSKGVDNLGRNVSLTADEYSEYQDITNKIAEQFPSLVSGYDEQGNALLSCKGNVEELTAAYEKLIHTQNQKILINTGDIEKDFANTIENANGKHWWSNGHGFWAGLFKNIELFNEQAPLGSLAAADFIGQIGARMFDYELKTDTAQNIQDLIDTTDEGKRKDILKKIKKDPYGLEELRDLLPSAGYDVGFFATDNKIIETLEKAAKEDPAKLQEVINNYYAQFDGVVEEQKSIAQAVLSEAFDVSSVISGLDYGNIGEDLQAVANQVVSSLDYNFFTKLQKEGKTVEQWTKEMLGQLNSIGKADNAQIEAAFDLQTQFNGGEISYGDYVRNLKDVGAVIDGLKLKSEAKEQLKISLGLDENGIVDQYNALIKRLTDTKNYDFDVSETEAKKLLDGLSSEELTVAVGVITDLSNNNYAETAEEIMTAIERELSIRGLALDLNIEVEKTKLESLATAISESFSGSGLSNESISAIEGMFGDLSSYDSSKLFERTANGIRLNSEEYRKLNSEYKKTNIAKVNRQMDSLGDIYNQTREELYRLTYGTDEYNAKASELSGIEEQIKSLEQLAAGYKGLSSAYQEWQMAESAGSQRDMYESIIEGFENIDDEISRGWYDDATIEFLELLSGKDLSTAGIAEVKKAYKGLGKEIEHTSYSVRDFFTVDDEGNSTNAGVYNFLDAIGQMEEEKFGGKDVVQRNKDGNIIGFDFQIVGGDKVIADALGISEELVQIMVRAADDAGFVVSMDGTYQQLDVLREKAQEASISLNNILKKNGKDGFDFNFNSSDVDDITNQLTEAQKILDTFRNTDGTINTKLEGADEALTVASTLQSMLDKLTRPTYMDIEVSQVEDEIQEPLRHLQELQRLTETEHQLKLSGADTSELEKSKQEVYKYFEGLDTDVKVKLGLVDEKGTPLTGDALKEKLNSGDIAIEATVDIQLEMDEKLGVLVDKALLDAGIIDNEEFEKRVNVYLNADVDNADAKNKTEQAVDEVAGKGDKSSSKNKSSNSKVEKNVDINVKANNVDTSDVNDKAKETIEKETKEDLVVETTVELETTIDEAAELIQKFEDKDITIDVKVKGLKEVKELNKNIDIDTKIKGNVDKFSEYVESAVALSKLDDNIVAKVTADIKGNVIDTFEYKINNLKTFANSIKDLKNVGTIKSKVVADVKGNVIDTFEYKINNLKTFVDSSKDISKIGIVKSKVTADVEGNVVDTFEYKINNLKVFSDSAKDISKIGNVESKVTANVDGDVIDTFEYKINNLKTYSDSAKNLKDIGNITSKVTASVDGDVIDTFEYKINNLKTFTDSAKDIKTIGSVTSKITADVDGNVIDTFEYKINNIKTFVDSAKDISKVGNVTSKVTADVNGNVVDTFEYKINNLKVYSDSAKDISKIGNVTSSVEANVSGDVIDTFEYKINNLKTFADSAKDISKIGTVTSSVEANVSGDVIDTFEYKINNLKLYSDSAKNLKDIGDVTSSVKANVDGNVIDTFEYKINNLKTFTDSAKDIKAIGSVTSKVTASVDGDVIDTFEYKINNLKTFSDSAKNLKSIGTVTSKVTADVEGNVIDTFEYKINNLELFADAANELKNTGSPTSKVTADVSGNVINTSEEKLGKLEVFADGANKLKGTGSPTSNVTANVSGNAITDDTVVTDLENFASVVSGMTSQTVTVKVTANVDSEKINNAINLLTKVSSSGVFKDYKATVQVGATVATIDDTVVQNYQPPEKDGKVKYSVDPESSVFTWTAPSKDGTVNYSAEVEALTYAQKNKTGTITYKAKVEGVGGAAGTAHANGSTSGRAFAQGNWGIKGNGVALGGELGRELVVRDGKFFTVGDEGAEFFRYKKNDIVFNAAQTESLFKYGGIKGANPRGTMLATGTAFAEGSAFPNGSTGTGGAGKVNGNSASSNSPSSSGSKNKSNNSKSSSSSEAEEFKETIDWIETAIDRIERAIDNLDKKASFVYKTWSSRNKALTSEITKVGDEIKLQQQAYNRYIQEANSVGLSSSWAKKVREGKVDIETIKDEALAEKIKDYETWYEKALDCKDAIEELKETESELYAQRFENVQSQYDAVLQGYEHTETMLNEYISQAEEQGHIVSKEYYTNLIANEKQNINTLKQEQSDLIKTRDEAVDEGKIAKYSEEW